MAEMSAAPAWSVVIPTLNEESELEACLASVRAARRPGAVEAVVADGGSSDGTLALARRLADKALEAPRGRGTQLNAGARASRGASLLFLHADSRLPDRWDEILEAAWTRPGVSATAFRIRYDQPGWRYRLIEGAMHLKARLGGTVYGDHGLATRRSIFEKVGGFPAIPLLEDVSLARRLMREGRLVLVEGPVRASPRRQLAAGPLRNALRNDWLLVRWALGADPEDLYKEYYGQ